MHVMLDLETWSTKSDGLIVSIGAVKFDPQTPQQIYDRFEVHVDPVDAQRYGFHVDADTVLWWMAEERAAARNHFMQADKLDLGSALEGFRLWYLEDDIEGVWGNGAAFDNVLLRTAFEKIGLEEPWPFWMDRCYRTMKSLHNVPDLTRFGTHHTALEDAVSQALHLQEIVAHLRLLV